MVPAIANYEVRRELERAVRAADIAALDAWNGAVPDRYLPLSDAALRLGAELWARPQQRRDDRPPEGVSSSLPDDTEASVWNTRWR